NAEALAELLRAAGVEHDYLSLSEPERTAVLVRELKNPRPLAHPHRAWSESTAEVLALFQTTRRMQEELGHDACNVYIVSMTAGASRRTGSAIARSASWPTSAARKASACCSSMGAGARSAGAAGRPTARSWASPGAAWRLEYGSPSRARWRSRATGIAGSRIATWSRPSTPSCAPGCATPPLPCPPRSG